MGMTCYIIQLTSITAAPATEILYYGTHAVTLGSVFYEPRVMNPGLVSQSMFAPGTTGGQSSGGFGAIDLANSDGGLDFMADRGFSSCKVFEGLTTATTIGEFSLILTGVVEQVEFSLNTISLRLKDNTYLLDVPVKLSAYGGTNTLPAGVDGLSDLKGKEKPRLFGTCYNFEPVCVNTARLIYQFNDAAASGILGVRDNGVGLASGWSRTYDALISVGTSNTFTTPGGYPQTVINCPAHGFTTGKMIVVTSSGTLPAPLTPGQFWFVYKISTDTLSLHPTAADATANLNAVAITTAGAGTHTMEYNITAAGYYDYTLSASGSYIRLGATPVGSVTMGAYVTGTIGQCFKALAAEKGLTVVQQSILDLDRALPITSTWGLYTGQKGLTYKAVFDALAQAGIWWGFDNRGYFWVKQLTVATSSVTLNLTTAEILEVDRVATEDSTRGIPIYRVVVRYKPNDAKQTQLSGSAYRQTPVEAKYYESEYLEAVKEETTIKNFYPLAAEIVINSVYQDITTAQAEADRQFALRSSRKDRLRVQLATAAVTMPVNRIWDADAITETLFTVIYHSAVVFGTYVYVFGGYNSSVCCRFNLATPQWIWGNSSIADLPAVCHYAAAVQYGNYAYLLGGANTSASIATCLRVDLTVPGIPWDDAAVTDLPVARGLHTAVISGSYVYVIGGMTTVSVNSVLRLDLSSPASAWTTMGWTLPNVRDSHISFVYGSYIYVMGGFEFSYRSLTASCIRINPAVGGTWDTTSIPPLPVAMRSMQHALIGSTIHIIGGVISSTASICTYSLDLDNLSAGWSASGEKIAELPVGRYGAITAQYNGRIYIVGGHNGVSEISSTISLLAENDKAELASIGRNVKITMPRYGYTAGRNMKIIGSEIDLNAGKTTLELWGY